ncbi:MAG: hypothetical protein WBE72_13905 [Terracidiphilus sp.]
MIRSLYSRQTRPRTAAIVSGMNGLRRFAGGIAAAFAAAFICAPLLAPGPARAQVLTIDTSGSGVATTNAPVDRRYQQIAPTRVDLPKAELSTRTRLELERVLESEQGFAMRPFPRGRKGLTLVANGKLEPAGEGYLNMVISEGLCAKPGDRLVITDIKVEHARIVFALNGGPDFKHRFLRHVQIGMGDPDYGGNSVVPDEADPTGARLTLAFKDHVPDLTGAQVKALLAPLISFDVKTPIQAFTDTLPPQLKDAILNHQVWVGMSTDMVLYAKGQPQSKVREMDGQMPFEEWIYGKPPQDVDFVRINGNRVIRVEIAKIGQPLEIFTKDVVEGLMRSDGTPVMASNTRTIEEGDAEKDPNKEAPDAPPSLRNPGETLPDDQNRNAGVMRPVQMPKPHPEDEPGQNPDDQPPAPSTPASSTPAASAPAAAPAAPPAGSAQPTPAPSSTGTSQPTPPAGDNYAARP